MNKIIVYHASPTCITKFNFKNGVHFGGLNSAMEAGLRKMETPEYYNQSQLYMHKCLLTLPSKIYDCDDLGSTEAWLKEKERALKDNYSLIRYLNKYEPDVVPSYYVLDSSLLQIISCNKTTTDELLHHFQ